MLVILYQTMPVMFKIFYNKFIFILLFFSLLIPQLVVAFPITGGPRTVTISAQVVNNITPPPSGGGGGGGGSISIPTSVNFSGMAYPNSKVTILKDGQIAITTVADPNARFSVSINNLATDTYNFSVYGEDVNGVKSLSFSFPVYVTAGTTVNIAGIFLSPTINVDKSQVKKGDNLMVYGQTIPNADLGVIFHSDQEILKNTKTDATGLYKYNMDTTPLEYGNHDVKSKIAKDEVIAISREVPFIVGLVSRMQDNSNSCGTLRGDLNCDNKVNLIDFSIMAYWYKKLNPPNKVDLSGDGRVTLVDFSIMAFNWTG